jgi:uncharacterized protein
MKWTIQELLKRVNTDNTFEGNIDFTDCLENSDIVKISNTEVKGDFEIYDHTDFVFYMEVKCTVTMLCAITLKEVEVELDFDIEETLSTEKNDDFIHIDGITIDLLPIIWSNIILEKPMRVVSENADVNFEENNVEFETESTNNAFAQLKNFKN